MWNTDGLSRVIIFLKKKEMRLGRGFSPVSSFLKKHFLMHYNKKFLLEKEAII